MHQLKKLLSKLKLKDSQGDELDTTNKKLFNKFIDNFCSAKNRTILYRGTESIPEYNTSIFDIKRFADIMFSIGDKSMLSFRICNPKGLSICICNVNIATNKAFCKLI